MIKHHKSKLIRQKSDTGHWRGAKRRQRGVKGQWEALKWWRQNAKRRPSRPKERRGGVKWQ